MSVSIKDFLKARRDRALGSLMGHAERNFFDRLTDVERKEFRGVVLDALNAYHDSILDLWKSDDTMRNEEVIALMARVERHLNK